MPKERKSFPLRMDPEIYQAIESWAADEFRSVNAHIEFLLRESLRKSGRLKRGAPPEPPQEGQTD
ncbi:Arc family DNA-binding protein [Paenibacillus albicereus]|uniref:Arc family DNA-binding protein n=1 Tax=Paenibacillus albicereus TaxID=2726185 RepID=A0A6H2GUU6_9BACL|nr:Arc family DNA-binding protein [Paenibacillus albicereus]QJC51194.1 Arc family DNA-binding protein [Paenibacillus albicereus]